MELKAIAQSKFSPTFDKQLFEFNIFSLRDISRQVHVSYPCLPNKVILRNWDEEIFRTQPCVVTQMSDAGDTAKILGFNSREGVHFHH